MDFNLLPWRQDKVVNEVRGMRRIFIAVMTLAVVTSVACDVFVRMQLAKLQADVDQLQNHMQLQVHASETINSKDVGMNDLMTALQQTGMYGICVTSLDKQANKVMIEGLANRAEGLLAFVQTAEHGNLIPATRVESMQQDQYGGLLRFKLSLAY